MAQAMIAEEKEFTLSTVTSVMVNPTGGICFLVKPKQDFLPKIQIPFTRPNWNSLVGKARPAINRAIQEKVKMNFVYHNHTRVVQLIWREGEQYQVHLMVYSMKGNVNSTMCVFLTQSEYEKLDEQFTAISQHLNIFSNETEKKTLITGHRCKITDESLTINVPGTKKIFLRAADAVKERDRIEEKFPDTEGVVEIVEEMAGVPDEGGFLRKVFLTMVFFSCKVKHEMRWCRACRGGVDLDDEEAHDSEEGACHPPRGMEQVVSEQIKDVLESLNSDNVKDVFKSLWRNLGLSPPNNIDFHLHQIHNIMEVKHTHRLVMYHLDNFPFKLQDDPEYIMIGDEVEKVIRLALGEGEFQKDGSERDGVDTPDTLTPQSVNKKRKLE